MPIFVFIYAYLRFHLCLSSFSFMPIFKIKVAYLFLQRQATLFNLEAVWNLFQLFIKNVFEDFQLFL